MPRRNIFVMAIRRRVSNARGQSAVLDGPQSVVPVGGCWSYWITVWYLRWRSRRLSLVPTGFTIRQSLRRLGHPTTLIAWLSLSTLMALGRVQLLYGQALPTSFASDEVLQTGMIVRLDSSDTSKVRAARRGDGDKIYGVVVRPNDSPIKLSRDGQQYLVAHTGRYDVLVSDQGGAISTGDYLTISSLTGVAMKAAPSDLFVVGKAATSFSDTSQMSAATTVNIDGGGLRLQVGQILADVQPAANPQARTEPLVPGVLKRAAGAVAGKQISAARIYSGLLVLGATTFIAGGLLISSVKAGVAAIGRNPLGKTAIIRGIGQASLTALIVFVIGLFGVYLLLKL